MEIQFYNVRQIDSILEKLSPLRQKLDKMLNLSRLPENTRGVFVSNNNLMRICLIAGLGLKDERKLEEIKEIKLSKSGMRISASFFTKDNMTSFYSAILKIRYKDLNINWDDIPLVSRILGYEMLRGYNFLSEESNLNTYLYHISTKSSSIGKVPLLKLIIGNYEGEIDAELDINSKDITNSQILVAGATGSGKTNLLAVLMQQIRTQSVDTPYPVNFLLFDYKGEFSDPQNQFWLKYFETDSSAILNPMESPLPFTPFKDFRGKTQNEINLYSTSMATALCAIERATISANMSNRLSEAIRNAYNKTNGAPIDFNLMLDEYMALLSSPDKKDSVYSTLNQLCINNIFEKSDKINLIKDCYIINMEKFPKDGPLAKAIVYFVISKLNNIYEQLEKQDVCEDCVEIRHFTIIDEAHYMLDFDNAPLRNLIAVGRNKGMSVILATQNMASFQSKHFDFYANAQYPLIMKQQTISDPVIKDLFGVNGKELAEIRSEISGLNKGELIMKDNMSLNLGIGRKYKKLKVTHLI